jgi:hypothetical protein
MAEVGLRVNEACRLDLHDVTVAAGLALLGSVGLRRPVVSVRSDACGVKTVVAVS